MTLNVNFNLRGWSVYANAMAAEIEKAYCALGRVGSNEDPYYLKTHQIFSSAMFPAEPTDENEQGLCADFHVAAAYMARRELIDGKPDPIDTYDRRPFAAVTITPYVERTTDGKFDLRVIMTRRLMGATHATTGNRRLRPTIVSTVMGSQLNNTDWDLTGLAMNEDVIAACANCGNFFTEARRPSHIEGLLDFTDKLQERSSNVFFHNFPRALHNDDFELSSFNPFNGDTSVYVDKVGIALYQAIPGRRGMRMLAEVFFKTELIPEKVGTIPGTQDQGFEEPEHVKIHIVGFDHTTKEEIVSGKELGVVLQTTAGAGGVQWNYRMGELLDDKVFSDIVTPVGLFLADIAKEANRPIELQGFPALREVLSATVREDCEAIPLVTDTEYYSVVAIPPYVRIPGKEEVFGYSLWHVGLHDTKGSKEIASVIFEAALLRDPSKLELTAFTKADPSKRFLDERWIIDVGPSLNDNDKRDRIDYEAQRTHTAAVARSVAIYFSHVVKTGKV